MGDAIIPVELTATALFKSGDKLTEFWMHRATVIALVIVLKDHFPISGNVINDHLAHHQIGKGVTRYAVYAFSECGDKGCVVGIVQMDKKKAAPFSEWKGV
jgi:hypothetical protein